jgi:hypothetical protein
MRGVPKTIGTAHDLDVVKDMFPDDYKRICQQLLDGRYVWEKKDTVLEKDVSKVVETVDLKLVTSEVDGKAAYFTMQRVEDPSAKLFKLGLTVADVTKVVEAIRG